MISRSIGACILNLPSVPSWGSCSLTWKINMEKYVKSSMSASNVRCSKLWSFGWESRHTKRRRTKRDSTWIWLRLSSDACTTPLQQRCGLYFQVVLAGVVGIQSVRTTRSGWATGVERTTTAWWYLYLAYCPPRWLTDFVPPVGHVALWKRPKQNIDRRVLLTNRRRRR